MAIVHTYNYGETAQGNGQMPDANSIYEIGSITKTFTATLLAYYANEGKVKLNDPITEYLPDSVATNKQLQSITLEMLANHTSGCRDCPIISNSIPPTPTILIKITVSNIFSNI